ncbi:DUF3268 family zinc-finger domain-containing protein [Vibrio fluvialis]|nr:DUF3268 family zinc-finger domain-containing protein [Vibrio fluvialis]
MSKGYRTLEDGKIVVDCPYCGSQAKLVKGKVIYPRRQDLFNKNFYLCENGHDRAYVGCHKGTATPLGRLADANLRSDKSAAHCAFDRLWNEGHMKRGEAYKWLAEQLGIQQEECHIGMFDRVTCRKVVEISNQRFTEINGESSHV